MAIVEHPLHALKQYIPENSFDDVVQFINQYKIHLTVTRKRRSVLGDYRHPFQGKNHRITVNGNLNKFEFLITLLHEIAHLLTFEHHQNRVEPHGKEWKNNYANLLVAFVQKNIFPNDVMKALQKSIMNPSATANGETELLKVLRKYSEAKNEQIVLVETLAIGAVFVTEKNKVFKKLEKRRKRYVCEELATGKLYAFNPIAEVMIVENKS